MQRWENLHPDRGAIPFERIAKLLGVDAETLRQAYEKGVKTMDQEALIKKAYEHKKQDDVDLARIRQALSAVSSPAFKEALIEKTNAADWNQAVTELARFLKEEQTDAVIRTLNAAVDRLFEEADQTGKTEGLESLCGFYRRMLTAGAVTLFPLSEHGADKHFLIHGTEQVFPLIFVMDRHNERSGSARLSHGENDIMFDENPDATLCIDIRDYGVGGGTEQEDYQEWAYRVVKAIGETVGLPKACPELQDDKAFKAYRQALNGELGARLHTDEYLIARHGEDKPVPPQVLAQLQEWLKELHLFHYIGDDESGLTSALHGKHMVLGRWLISGEQKLATKLRNTNAQPCRHGWQGYGTPQENTPSSTAMVPSSAKDDPNPQGTRGVSETLKAAGETAVQLTKQGAIATGNVEKMARGLDKVFSIFRDKKDDED